MTVFTSVPNSTFLDSFGAGQVTAGQISTLAGSTSMATAQAILGPLFSSDGTTPSVVSAGSSVFVGLMVNRAADPTSLLTADWATRQSAVADQTTIWATYGGNEAQYAQTMQALEGIVSADALSTPASAGYVSDATNRTIWLLLDTTDFANLFNTDLLEVAFTDQNGNLAEAPCWAGDLSLPAEFAPYIDGIWVDSGPTLSNPTVMNSTGSNPSAGAISLGNSTSAPVYATPAAIAANYNFPLDSDAATPAIAVIEVNLPDQTTLLDAYNAYLQAVGLDPVTAEQFQVVSGAGQSTNPSQEIALDISVIGGAAPSSTQLLYAPLAGTVFSAYQNAFFDFTNDPRVLTSSYSFNSRPTPNSPFQTAYQQLFVDGMLSNVSVHLAAGDLGSGGGGANGVANAVPSNAPTYALAVGGTSIASVTSAQLDGTLTSALVDGALVDLVALALASDPSTVFDLVAAGLVTLPGNLSTATPSAPSPVLASLFETVWQQQSFEPSSDYPSLDLPDGTLVTNFGQNQTGAGGVNTSIGVPWYQSNYGLQPTSSMGVGRGVPDVAALAQGDSMYVALNIAYLADPIRANLLTGNGGTSAAAPLWASLTAQFDAVFADLQLPDLGFYNDLLYQAAAVAPASFNDILLGNNTTSYYSNFQTPTGYYDAVSHTYITPTGDGYAAGPGYDLATGLGTPNGLVLARALAAIAQTQTNNLANAQSNAMVDTAAGTSTVAQTLLVQNNFYLSTDVLVQVGATAAVEMDVNTALGWTSRLAGQAVQGDNFDSALMPVLDGATKAVPYQIGVQAGDALGVSANGAALSAYQQALTNEFGFLQFGDAEGGITLARPVAIAQMAGGPDNQNAVVRIRQNGMDDAQIEVYEVDDLNGTIMVGGTAVTPGQAGYLAAASGRDYQLAGGGGSLLAGPGVGSFVQYEITGVGQGDIVALKYTNLTTNDIYWAFSQANAGGATAIYGYGLNIWGYDDRPVTGDHDFNDLVVQLDFTSTGGSGLLVN